MKSKYTTLKIFFHLAELEVPYCEGSATTNKFDKTASESETDNRNRQKDLKRK